MKKFLSIIFAMLAISSCMIVCEAKSQEVGVVVIGGAEYKTPEFYKIIQKEFDPKSGAKLVIGGDLQNKYQKFLFNRDMVGNDTPRRQDLIDFTASSGYGKILFVVIPEVNIEHQNNAKSRQKNRIYIQTDCYLCNNLNVIEVATTSQDFKSKTSDLRARRGAFKKCLEELAKSLNRAM